MGKESYEVVSLKDIFAFMGCILPQIHPFVNPKKGCNIDVRLVKVTIPQRCKIDKMGFHGI